jgi:hypothetical protein
LLEAALDFTEWLTWTKSFTLFGLGKQDNSWALLCSALAEFPTLTRLSLGGGYAYNLELPQLLETLGNMESSGIRTLELDGISTTGDLLGSRKLQVCFRSSMSFVMDLFRPRLTSAAETGRNCPIHDAQTT